ncbi:hypothetical protein DPEC_G00374180 [Dallia pectoralis]|nr:hypothetical protein DPEC_G00374180 [Dallia pectoralis]
MAMNLEDRSKRTQGESWRLPALQRCSKQSRISGQESPAGRVATAGDVCWHQAMGVTQWTLQFWKQQAEVSVQIWKSPETRAKPRKAERLAGSPAQRPVVSSGREGEESEGRHHNMIRRRDCSYQPTFIALRSAKGGTRRRRGLTGQSWAGLRWPSGLRGLGGLEGSVAGKTGEYLFQVSVKCGK